MSKCYLVFIRQESYKCLVEKIGLLDELCSGMNSSTLDISSLLMNHKCVCLCVCFKTETQILKI